MDSAPPSCGSTETPKWHSMFSRQVQTKCPVCLAPATMKQINLHLDNGCPRAASADVCGPEVNAAQIRGATPPPAKKLKASSSGSNLQSDVREIDGRVPYYLHNFQTMVRGVMEESDDVALFSADNLQWVQRFRSCSLDAMKLYVRLFQRKYAWILASAISYEEIVQLDSALQELVDEKFLLDGSHLQDLEETLNLLSAANVRKLCKAMNLSAKGSQKQDFVKALVGHAAPRNRSCFVLNSPNSMKDIILKKARTFMERCYKLSAEARTVFQRVLLLYSLPNWWEMRDSDRNQSAPQLTTLLLQNQGKLLFPEYEIVRHAKIFSEEADILRFERAAALEEGLADIFRDKTWNEGGAVVKDACDFFQQILANQGVQDHDLGLPEFLRKFCAGSVVAFVLTRCVDLLERQKSHEEACHILRKLIEQKVYLPDYAGSWYERLSLDLSQHLKMPEQALEAVRQGLDDGRVREARRLALCQRAVKICQAKKNAATFGAVQLEPLRCHPLWMQPACPDEIFIKGKLMPNAGGATNSKTVFLLEKRSVSDDDSEHSVSYLCSVEEYVRQYLKSESGFTHGVHAESSIVHTVFGILFWDVIYGIAVPDAFRNPQQSLPLDLNSDQFYSNRSHVIDLRVDELIGWSKEQLCQFAAHRWTASCHVSNSLCHWDLFSSQNELTGLLSCLSGRQWSAICLRLAKHFRHTRSGFPDLTVWNPAEQRCQFVEVKGPNDRLSNKQILWMEYLNEHDIPAVVCHVEAAAQVAGFKE